MPSTNVTREKFLSALDEYVTQIKAGIDEPHFAFVLGLCAPILNEKGKKIGLMTNGLMSAEDVTSLAMANMHVLQRFMEKVDGAYPWEIVDFSKGVPVENMN